MKTINIAKEFSEVPAGRFLDDGPDNGERFRNEFLEPTLSTGGSVNIELDGTDGYGSSFLEEAFGGIVRKLRLSEIDALKRIQLTGSDETYKVEITAYIKDAARKLNK
ncbi:STAS-like domain-containing protein [Cupriavidus oxalaticus]|jgi:hypothetical protein|uniref:STAS-like domain-containing protein n=1 Tax=Cupriavidus oxalaticus TaxID=96344 RepID=UPI0040338507